MKGSDNVVALRVGFSVVVVADSLEFCGGNVVISLESDELELSPESPSSSSALSSIAPSVVDVVLLVVVASDVVDEAVVVVVKLVVVVVVVVVSRARFLFFAGPLSHNPSKRRKRR